MEKQEKDNKHSNLYIEVNLDYPEDVPFPNGNYYTLYIKNKRNSLYYGEWDGLKHVAKKKKGIFKKVKGDLYQEIEKIRKNQEISQERNLYIVFNNIICQIKRDKTFHLRNSKKLLMVFG
ncbi:hypothetical protein ACQUDY_12140, partial [Enterococcus faecium]